jgi:putative ABC transport system permease protein
MHKWLENFAYSVDMKFWIYFLAATLAFVIALVTVSFQSLKAALTNPVESLRYE